MDILLHVAVLLARNRLWLLPGFLVLAFVAGATACRRVATPSLIAALGLANFLGGPLLCG